MSALRQLRLLDLCCKQGGAGKGYADAGFEVVGVDIEPQPRYPYRFWATDAVAILENLTDELDIEFDAIHISPPCQAYSATQRIRSNDHLELIDKLRPLLKRTGLPYVIENVPGAPLRDPVMLCGAMFPYLSVYRHRLFETNFPVWQPVHPEHLAPTTKMGRPPVEGEFMHVVGNFSGVERARRAMGIDWMTRDGLREAIPPAYTNFIALQLLDHLSERAA